MIRCLALLSMILAAGCSPAVKLPMPGDAPEWRKYQRHFGICPICSADNPSDGPGTICEEAYELLLAAMEAESPLWRMSPRDGYHYKGPEIDGWRWNVAKQKWEEV